MQQVRLAIENGNKETFFSLVSKARKKRIFPEKAVSEYQDRCLDCRGQSYSVVKNANQYSFKRAILYARKGDWVNAVYQMLYFTEITN